MNTSKRTALKYPHVNFRTNLDTNSKTPVSHITAKHWCLLWWLMLSERLPLHYSII